jgi:hypothetical protein
VVCDDNPLPDRGKTTYPDTSGDDIGVCCHSTVTMLSYDGWLMTDQAYKGVQWLRPFW